jgi:putative Holliday junction resolvase
MTGRILGLDVGDVRIGVAVSDPLGIIAQPHSVIRCISPRQDVEAIRTVVGETEAVRVVVGVPLNREGKPGPQAEKVLQLVAGLREALDVEVVTQDERYSTAAAERMLIAADVRRKGRKKVVDKVAAHLILQTYLDRLRNAARQQP